MWTEQRACDFTVRSVLTCLTIHSVSRTCPDFTSHLNTNTRWPRSPREQTHTVYSIHTHESELIMGCSQKCVREAVMLSVHVCECLTPADVSSYSETRMRNWETQRDGEGVTHMWQDWAALLMKEKHKNFNTHTIIKPVMGQIWPTATEYDVTNITSK